MFCGNCGKELNEGAEFCSQCGMTVAGAAAEETRAPAEPTVAGGGNSGVACVLHILSFILYALGIADFVLGNFFGVDFTGVSWSPIVFGLVGGGLSSLAGKLSSPPEGEQGDEQDGGQG